MEITNDQNKAINDIVQLIALKFGDEKRET